MARRLSSIFSLGSSTSDQTNNGSRRSSAVLPHQLPKQVGREKLVRKSTPDLRTLTPPSQSQTHHAPEQPSAPNASFLSPQFTPIQSPALSASGQSSMPPPPLDRKAVPIRNEDYLPGTRPLSRGSGADVRASSRDGSGSNSRTASPGLLPRPVTPTTEKRLSKRMSWFPGKGGHESPGRNSSIPASLAWILGPQSQDKTYYDLTPLINFQKVN